MDTLTLAARAAEATIGPFDQYPLFSETVIEWTLSRRCPGAVIVRLETTIGRYGVLWTSWWL